MCIKYIPVYYECADGVLSIKKVGVICGKNKQRYPIMIPLKLYLTFCDRLIIAPITAHYLTYLFGHKYFTNTVFELDCLEDMSPLFVQKLADKTCVNIKRTYTHKGRSRKVTNAIKQRMGIIHDT